LDKTDHGEIKRNGINYGSLVGSPAVAGNDIDIDQNYNLPGSSGTLFVQKPMRVQTGAPCAKQGCLDRHHCWKHGQGYCVREGCDRIRESAQEMAQTTSIV
jgi:hypothetical protein